MEVATDFLFVVKCVFFLLLLVYDVGIVRCMICVYVYMYIKILNNNICINTSTSNRYGGGGAVDFGK